MLNTPSSAKFICEELKKRGHSAWLVGGAVRDSFMGRKAHDWDIATSALPNEVQSYFSKVIPTGIEHGTVTIMIEKEGYEVTTYRGESEYTDGRHPDSVVFLNTIEEDLARRDLTINAMAYDPIEDVFCDPYHGREDIEKKIIRAVGSAKDRFLEDGLRILRAIRFGSVLEFDLDNEVIEAIKDKEVQNRFNVVSIERVRDELIKVMESSSKPSKAFQSMLECGLLEIILPEMMNMVGCEQNRYHEFDVWKHTLETLDATPKDFDLRFAALFHDIGKPASKGVNEQGDGTFHNHELIGETMTIEVMNRLRFSNEETNCISHLVRHHFIRYESNWTDSSVRRWVRKVGKNNIENLFELANADIKGKGKAKKALEGIWIEEMRGRIERLENESPILSNIKELAVNGKDVMRHLRIGAGPRVGEILRALLEIVTDDPTLNRKEVLLNKVDSL